MFEDIWKKWKLLLNSTDVTTLFKTTKSCNIVDVWWLFFSPGTDKWICERNQKRPREVRPWYFGLNVSSHSESGLRSLQSLFLPTWKRSTGLSATDVGNTLKLHRFHCFRLAVGMMTSTWCMYLSRQWCAGMVPALVPTSQEGLKELIKDGWQTFQTSQSSKESVFGGFNSTSAALFREPLLKSIYCI